MVGAVSCGTACCVGAAQQSHHTQAVAVHTGDPPASAMLKHCSSRHPCLQLHRCCSGYARTLLCPGWFEGVCRPPRYAGWSISCTVSWTRYVGYGCASRRYLVMLVAVFVFALVALHSTALLRCRCVCSILGAWLSNSWGCARISATRLQMASQALVHHFGFVAYIYLVPLVCMLALCAFSHCMQLCIQVFRRACCCVHLDIVCIHAFRCLSGVICACCCMHSDLVRIQVLRRARYCMHLHFVCMHAFRHLGVHGATVAVSAPDAPVLSGTCNAYIDAV